MSLRTAVRLAEILQEYGVHVPGDVKDSEKNGRN